MNVPTYQPPPAARWYTNERKSILNNALLQGCTNRTNRPTDFLYGYISTTTTVYSKVGWYRLVQHISTNAALKKVYQPPRWYGLVQVGTRRALDNPPTESVG